jgi:hypothetical protein
VYPQKAFIPDSQALNSSSFIGSASNATLLEPLFKFYPDASLMHQNGGNSGARDDSGPLGIEPTVSSVANTVNMMVWGSDGSLTCGYANTSADNSPMLGIVALDPATLQILAAWYPPGNETLRLSYLEYIKETNDVLLSTKEGHIYIVHRDNCNGNPQFTTTRTISVASALQPDEQLLNAMYDIAGNIWFTSGGTINGGDSPQNSLTFGYVTPNGTIIKTRVQNEMAENGLAVSGMDVYMVTGPGGMTNSTNATGYMYSMTSDRHRGIKIRWKVPYTAESRMQTGSAPRGSGSSPALLTDRYVVITDRSSPQVNLNVYHQKPQRTAQKQLACQVPLFTPGKSNNDNAVLAHFDGVTNGFVIQNNYNIPPVYIQKPGVPFDVNGDWNDMSKMAGGMTRIDVNDDGTCSTRWTNPDLAIKGVSILSTKTGLIYVYVQDTERSPMGEYIWYVAAVDWNTGEIAFKIRTGTGGIFNDNYLQASVGPDGTFYQTVLGGIVGVRDRRKVL